MVGMIVTIIIIVVLLFIVAVLVGARQLFLLINPQANFESSMKTKALDIFMYLGISIALIVSVTNFLQIIFSAIDRKFIDILNYTNFVDSTHSDVRFAVASLVVMFPIYVGLSWYVSNDIKKFIYKQDLTVRKMMIYCTLFITVLTLIGTLVSVIYNYLGGDLSSSFALKAGSIFGVALSLFGYYYYSLKRDYAQPSIVPACITIAASVVVIASVIWSITIIGSPSVMRAKKIDSLRLTDISGIQGQILNRIQMTDKLPTTIAELTNALQGYQVPVDPITKEPYVYRVIQQPSIKMNFTTNKKEMTNQAIFELCATFDTVRKVDSRGMSIPMQPIDKNGLMVADSMYLASNYYYDGDQSPFWNHDIGETCFRRIISPDMYYGR